MMDEPKAVIVNFIVIEKIKIKRSKLFFSKKKEANYVQTGMIKIKRSKLCTHFLHTLMSTSALLLRPSYLFSHNLP